MEKMEKNEIDKYTILKLMCNKMNFRYNDEATEFLKELKEGRDYSEMGIINRWCQLVIDNTLQNIAALDCVKIIIDK